MTVEIKADIGVESLIFLMVSKDFHVLTVVLKYRKKEIVTLGRYLA